ncbi:hypothetical protein DPMN_073871 [Dreissena polymorpha]|uniref:Uncharacterized protein n=1 Tax=Dreissena polymorpha TaxID=45954 RepID=A0A9D4BL28_DREPO|nr:hypothetical protein DPMN_073871 [Dreissena polymorpha]
MVRVSHDPTSKHIVMNLLKSKPNTNNSPSMCAFEVNVWVNAACKRNMFATTMLAPITFKRTGYCFWSSKYYVRHFIDNVIRLLIEYIFL